MESGPKNTRVTVMVDGEAVAVWSWACWRDAVVFRDPSDAGRLSRGEVWLADTRGNLIDPDGNVVDGAAIILRESHET
ncbi:MAG: hypothetical protein ABR527_08610 [Gemmatimonadota bacterium]